MFSPLKNSAREVLFFPVMNEESNVQNDYVACQMSTTNKPPKWVLDPFAMPSALSYTHTSFLPKSLMKPKFSGPRVCSPITTNEKKALPQKRKHDNHQVHPKKAITVQGR